MFFPGTPFELPRAGTSQKLFLVARIVPNFVPNSPECGATSPHGQTPHQHLAPSAAPPLLDPGDEERATGLNERLQRGRNRGFGCADRLIGRTEAG